MEAEVVVKRRGQRTERGGDGHPHFSGQLHGPERQLHVHVRQFPARRDPLTKGVLKKWRHVFESVGPL